MTTTRFLKLIAALLALLAAVPAAAQQYPNRAIRVIVGFPPGGTSPSLIKLNFDPVKDFAFVTLVAESQNLLVVHPSLPVKSVKELSALSRVRPGDINFGSSGINAN